MNAQAEQKRHATGFTLLELCIVLFIMALMAGAAMPALRSAFVEQALRNDGAQVARMVKIAILASDEQQRACVLTLQKKTLSLASVPEADPDQGAASTNQNNSEDAAPVTVKLEYNLQFCDEKGRWSVPVEDSWQFRPNSLCPVQRLRVRVGDAFLEMNFNALTGDVEDESLSLP